MSYVRTRLGRLFYEERGAARRAGDPAIVLLHGLLFDGDMWRGQLEPLAELGRVVVFDGPGHGKSEPPPRFTLEEHADALFDAFGELGIGEGVLVGLSWGGMVGMRMALQHRGRVAGLALLDTSAVPDGLSNRLRYRAFIALHRRFGTSRALFDKEIAPLLFTPRTLREKAEMVDAAFRRTNGFERDGLARAALAVLCDRSSILAQLPRIDVPTLVMCGGEDRSTPPDEAEKIARAIPGARLVVLDGLGHMSAIEDPARINQHLVPFVRGVIASSSA